MTLDEEVAFLTGATITNARTTPEGWIILDYEKDGRNSTLSIQWNSVALDSLTEVFAIPQDPE